jgi:hypothetical protein
MKSKFGNIIGTLLGTLLGTTPPTPNPKTRRKFEPFLLILAHLIGCLEIYFPNYVHHSILHRLNASLSICFPNYISFPYQTQNLLGKKKKEKHFVVVSHLVVVGVLPHLN